jgi:exodeoxyribonuclease-3
VAQARIIGDVLKISTWNVNGVRARQAEVQAFIETERPDVLCLQELKAAPDQLPVWLAALDGYWCCWHGGKGYSGVAVLVRRAPERGEPSFAHPPFDFEHRAAFVDLPQARVASLYVPNGGKNLDDKMRFLEAVDGFAADAEREGRPLVLCGDFNVARTDMDLHPRERKPGAIGQRDDERALLERLIGRGLVDVNRQLDPDNAELFTWWAPWRKLRERNIGWRIDYVFASAPLAGRAMACRAERLVGTSDHGPVIAEFDA